MHLISLVREGPHQIYSESVDLQSPPFPLQGYLNTQPGGYFKVPVSETFQESSFFKHAICTKFTEARGPQNFSRFVEISLFATEAYFLFLVYYIFGEGSVYAAYRSGRGGEL